MCKMFWKVTLQFIAVDSDKLVYLSRGIYYFLLVVIKLALKCFWVITTSWIYEERTEDKPCVVVVDISWIQGWGGGGGGGGSLFPELYVNFNAITQVNWPTVPEFEFR